MVKKKNKAYIVLLAIILFFAIVLSFINPFSQSAFSDTPSGDIPRELYSFQADNSGGGKFECGSSYSFGSSPVYDNPSNNNINNIVPLSSKEYGDSCVKTHTGRCNYASIFENDFSNYKDYLGINIITSSNLFEHSVNSFNVTIDSPVSLQVRLWVWLRHQGINSYEYRDLSKNLVLLKQGKNNIEFVLPTNLKDDFYDLYVVATDVKEYTKYRSGVFGGSSVNTGPCYANTMFVQLSELETDNFLISPLPLWKVRIPSESCGTNYVAQFEGSSLCELENFKDLPCRIKGCPVTQNPFNPSENIAYSCMSNGLCAEPVYQVVNDKKECRPSEVYDEQTKACVNKYIYNSFISCPNGLASECSNPCPQQMSAVCDDKRCSYSGECKPEVDDSIIEQVDKASESVDVSGKIVDVVKTKDYTIYYVVLGFLLMIIALIIFWRFYKK